MRGFSVRTGKLLWTFHVVPQEGEPGTDSWGNDSWKYAGDLGAWNPLSADDELGYVFLPLTAPTSAAYGGWRPGDNLYSNSLVALDAKTGKRVWHFQMVHHDVWEYDNVGPPTLLRSDRERAPHQGGGAAEQERVPLRPRPTNGAPVWPITERPVPQSMVKGEHTSPTQPFPASRRRSIARHRRRRSHRLHPELRTRRARWRRACSADDTPPTVSTPEGTKGTLMSQGAWGAGNWNTGAFDPETNMYYAVSHTLAAPIGVSPTAGIADMTMDFQWAYTRPAPGAPPPPGQVRGLGPQLEGLPIWKPPYGRITAFNLNTGEQVWMAANGDGPRNHPLLKELHLPPLGIPNRAAPLLTRTLLFLGEGSDAVIGTPQVDWAWGTKFRAYDSSLNSLPLALVQTDAAVGHYRRADDVSGQGRRIHRRPDRREGSSGRTGRPRAGRRQAVGGARRGSGERASPFRCGDSHVRTD